jgi:FAD/FMN-containing dehydrogenase
VLELEVVTGEGAVVTCSEQKHRDVFDAVLAGQGQCAIITRVRLRLVPVKPMVREYMLSYADVPSLLSDLRDQRFDGVVGLNTPSADGGWAFSLIGYRQFAPPDEPDDAALTAGLRAIAGSRQKRDVDYATYVDGAAYVPDAQSHADLGLLIPGRQAARFLTDMLPRLRADDLGMAARMRVFVWNRSRFSRPLLRMPEQEHVVYVAMLRAGTTDPNTLARQLAGNRNLFEENRALGGTHYPYSALELTRADWRRHYGEAWRMLASAKQRYDPDNVFAAGPELTR